MMNEAIEFEKFLEEYPTYPHNPRFNKGDLVSVDFYEVEGRVFNGNIITDVEILDKGNIRYSFIDHMGRIQWFMEWKSSTDNNRPKKNGESWKSRYNYRVEKM